MTEPNLASLARPLALIVAAGAGCTGGADGVRLDSSFECRSRPDDATGYLQPICEHLVAELDTYPIDPNDLEIERVQAGDEVEYPIGGYDSADFDYVYLSCCYTGDIAVMDASTSRVRALQLGDM